MVAYRTRAVAISVVIVVLALVIGYSKYNRAKSGPGHRSPSRSGQQIKRSELTAAEVNYGIGPTPDPSVTYQPDVVIIGGGADAIRSQSANGFIWTIDGSAAHADELAPGKVFFATNRAVGRVLDVRKDGGNLVVVIGPVNLQEVLKEAHITINTPIDFDEAIPYTSTDLPGRIDVIARAEPPHAVSAIPAMFFRDPAPDVSNLVHFKVKPIANRFGVGLQADSDGGGLKLSAAATLHLSAPTAVAKIDITPTGGVNEASLTLTGGGGLTWSFEAGTDVGLKANVNGIIQPDTDFSIPLAAGGFPIALTVRQRLLVKTALGVRNTTLSASANYSFDGAFAIGVVRKQWTVGGPTNFEATQNLLKGTEGVSIGAAGLDLADEIKVIAGIGAYGFAAGPYFRVTPAIGVFKGSSAGMIQCKEATIDVKMSAGVGYVIPKVVTNIFNSILKALNIKYRIDGEGSLQAGNPISLYGKTLTLPGCKTDKG